jgi:translation elongation factor EF-4
VARDRIDRLEVAAKSLGAPCSETLRGFKTVKPMVFAGLFPVDAADL